MLFVEERDTCGAVFFLGYNRRNRQAQRTLRSVRSMDTEHRASIRSHIVDRLIGVTPVDGRQERALEGSFLMCGSG